MPVSALVVTLVEDPALVAATTAELRGDPRFEVGSEALGPFEASAGERRLPVALDTADEDENRRAWRWLQELPGVAFVDVLFVSFEDAADGGDLDPAPGQPAGLQCGSTANIRSA